MSTKRSARACLSRRQAIIAFLSLMLCMTTLVGCTRDDVASAVSTFAVQLEATLQPWGATAAVNAQAMETRIPAALATAKAQPTESVAFSPPIVQAIPSPTLTLTPAATETSPPIIAAEPTATNTPTMTATATPSPTSTATPYPEQMDTHGGFMVLISGGYFQMGATAESLVQECSLFREGCAPEWFAGSEPVHPVLLGRYYIDAHEITNEAYAGFMNDIGDGNSCLEHDCLEVTQSEIQVQDGIYTVADDAAQNPVAGVSWYGAAAYCEWRDARLPTEAEWEKAAAWDESGAVARRYPWGDEFDGSRANFCDASCAEPQAHTDLDDGFPIVAPVMSFTAGRSAFGTYDMAGNVWEWVVDWFDTNYYAQSPDADPPGPESGEDKVVRGGSWFDTGNFTAAAIRFPSNPENADRTIGFRCADDIP